MKIAIVGPEESKWKSKEQIEKAKRYIKNTLGMDINSHGDLGHTVLVSGHCHKGGVDIWAEEITDELGIQKEIHPAICTNETFIKNGHDEVMHDFQVPSGHYWIYHYKPRNIGMAKSCDVLYCIVPKMPKGDQEYCSEYSQSYCRHCNEWGHPTNGGCWTMKYAKSIGKETHLVIIE